MYVRPADAVGSDVQLRVALVETGYPGHPVIGSMASGMIHCGSRAYHWVPGCLVDVSNEICLRPISQ